MKTIQDEFVAHVQNFASQLKSILDELAAHIQTFFQDNNNDESALLPENPSLEQGEPSVPTLEQGEPSIPIPSPVEVPGEEPFFQDSEPPVTEDIILLEEELLEVEQPNLPILEPQPPPLEVQPDEEIPSSSFVDV